MPFHRVSLRPIVGTSLPLILQSHHASPRSLNLLPLLRRRYLLRNLSAPSTKSLSKAHPTATPPPPSTPPKTITPPQAQKPPPHRSLNPPTSLIRYALPALTLLLALDFIFTNIFQLMTVTGPSMSPFLNTDAASSPAASSSSSSKDTVFISLVKPAQDLRRGHVVAFHSPLHPEMMAVKRVVALGGDVVEVRGGGGTVGGVSVGQGKRQGEKKERPTVVVVPPGHIWVEGEHPEGSRWSIDSNTYGPVPVGLLVGRVEAVVWPWARRGWVRWQDWRGSGRVREGRDVGKMVEVEVFGLE